eukprot:424251_1
MANSQLSTPKQPNLPKGKDQEYKEICDLLHGEDHVAQPELPNIINTQQPGSTVPKHVDYKLAVAVDFGTDGLGIAYAYNGKIYVHSKYRAKRFASAIKPKTMVLLNPSGDAAAFGMEARFTYYLYTHSTNHTSDTINSKQIHEFA